MMRDLYVLGAGGHAKVVVSTALALGLRVKGLLDDDPQKKGMDVLGIQVRGRVQDFGFNGSVQGVIAIGDNKARKRLAKTLRDWEWIILVHPHAYVDPTANLGSGTVVFAGAVIQPNAQIGSHVIVNTAATVDHDCLVSDFVHLAPGSHLAGGVTVEEGAFIGMGAVVLPGVKVGAWSVVGAGAVVVTDLPPYVTAVGIPARPIKKKVEVTHESSHIDVGSGDF